MNYQEMEQSHWVCYQLPHNAYYYGEVAYLDEHGVVHPKDNAEVAANPKCKLIRHGFGIYLYDCQATIPSRYEGFWEKDQKNGTGKLSIGGKFSYEGCFKDGCYHESGRMSWANGDLYEGQWKKNKMDGAGQFKQHNGNILKGSFKANYFIHENVLRNPQMPEEEYELFRKQRKEIIKQKEKNEKIKHGFLERITRDSLGRLKEFVEKSNKNNRVPLLVASEHAKFTLADLVDSLGKQVCHVFDLRKAYLLKGQERHNYKMQFAVMTNSTLCKGESLIINLDESDGNYKQVFYPDLKEFYDASGFTASTWSRTLMRKKEISEKVVGEEKIHEDYQILVWSKYKLRDQLSPEQIKEKLQTRFQSILPFIKLDIIFITEKVVPQ